MVSCATSDRKLWFKAWHASAEHVLMPTNVRPSKTTEKEYGHEKEQERCIYKRVTARIQSVRASGGFRAVLIIRTQRRLAKDY
jgi:hypothetical protein